MSSLLAVLAFTTAHAATQNVVASDDGVSIQTRLDVLCGSGDAINTLRFAAAEVTISSGEVLEYPNSALGPAEDCGGGTLVIEGQNATIIAGATDTPQDLLTIREGINLEVRDLTIRGVQFGDAGTENIDINDPNADSLEDLVITQCAGRSINSATRGIYIDGTDVTAGSEFSEVTLENVEMRCLFAAGDGGAVLVEGGKITIDNSRFVGNAASGSGGAVGIKGGLNGVLLEAGGTGLALNVINNSRFDRNDALFGGAISNYFLGNQSTVIDSYFFSNNGELGAGALQFEGQSNVVIERNQFDEQNSEQFDPGQRGGAVTVETGEALMFKNNIVCGSWAGRGGGLYVDSVSDVDVLNSVFAENGALEFGGGVFFADTQDEGMDINVINNTFAGNEAGRLPDFLTAQFVDFVIGGGGAATFFGVNPVFQNNVVAYSDYGGGVFGEYVPFTTNGFQIGDPLIVFNNLFFQNTDGLSAVHITGDFASIATHPSNVIDLDPQMQYLGLGEFNCTPEAFYTTLDSPVIDAGGGPPQAGSSVPGICFDRVDLSIPPNFLFEDAQDGEPALDGPCDIGAFGGDFALFRKDTDQDGVSNLFDCNDLDPDIAPGQPEICDFDDNDCNGIVDDDLDITWYPDLDQDTYGDEDGAFLLSCTPPGGGLVPNSDDCDDSNGVVFLGASEVCDGLDNDCNGEIDDGLTFVSYYPDQDGDGYGSSTFIEACQSPGADFITTPGDCADNDPTRYPGAIEPCDGIDNDCDGLVDAADVDAVGIETFYPDRDGDGFGDNALEERRCSDDPPPAGINQPGDCNDTNPDINAGAPELCLNIGVDEDCDGVFDEIDENTGDALKVYADADGDGVGSSVIFQLVCSASPPPGFVLEQGDCDDADINIGVCNQACGGCASGTEPAGGLMFLLGGLAMFFRRRR